MATFSSRQTERRKHILVSRRNLWVFGIHLHGRVTIFNLLNLFDCCRDELASTMSASPFNSETPDRPMLRRVITR